MDNGSIAYMNIAIVKYWGKNKYVPNLLPLQPSISYRAKYLYTKTIITKNNVDVFYLNGVLQDDEETKKIFSFIDKLISDRDKIKIESINHMPTAAGLASSASAYSALTMEINRYFNLKLTNKEMAKLSTIGSGSAGRSFYNISAFEENGEIYPIDTELSMGMLAIVFNKNKKDISSRNGMDIAVKTSKIFDKWIDVARDSFIKVKKALKDNDFKTIGETMEYNTLFMHNTTIRSNPSFTYLTKETYKCMRYIKEMRKLGIKAYFTMDAGPNVKLLYLLEDEEKVLEYINRKYRGKIILC